MTSGGAGVIWLYDLARRTEVRFTSEDSRTPIWSPMGDRIAYFDKRGIYQKASSGVGEGELLVKNTNDGQLILSQWSRDGRFIIYQAFDSKTRKLWVLPMGQNTPADRKPSLFLQTEFNELQGQLSPDSHWIAYTSDESGQREVYVRPFPALDNKWKISTSGGVQPRWRADGKELFYVAGDGKMTAVTVKAESGSKTSFEPGTPVPLFDANTRQGPGNSAHQYDVTADGKRFVVATTTGSGAAQALAVITNGNAALGK